MTRIGIRQKTFRKTTQLKRRNMNTLTLKLMGRASLAVFAGVIFALAPSFAQTSPDDHRENGQKLEGVWTTVVTTRDCVTGVLGRSFPAMESYQRGGTMVEFSTGANTATPVSGRTTAQGVWKYESNGVYSGTFQFFRINIDGTYVGKTIGMVEITLGEDPNSFTSVQRQQGYDLVGNPLPARCDSRVGTRMQ